MSNTVIQIENLSKQYRLGQVGTGTLSQDLNKIYHKLRGLEDPYLKIGEVNDRTQKGNSNYVWSLKDINLNVKQGEVLGIVGKNGAGKSTLLKILSKVTGPTTGSIKIKGRIASLLEVGTGFHPELTGKENIFQNGLILGMSKNEVQSKLDEIIEFSGVEKYINTPVKRYSSGMYVRLAFAVAAHLEPEILIVDEVLAVGDLEFQKKCLGKMENISNQGRTIIFVSHNMAAMKLLCTRAILLENGQNIYEGSVDETINKYRNYFEKLIQNEILFESPEQIIENEHLKMHSISVRPTIGDEINVISGVSIHLKFTNKLERKNIEVSIFIFTNEDILLFEACCILFENSNSKKCNLEVEWKIPGNLLSHGKYKIKIVFGENHKHLLYSKDDIIGFKIERGSQNSLENFMAQGLISPVIGSKLTILD